MCGIAGFWNLDGRPVNREELIRFTNQLAHRGPDGWDIHVDESANLGFGHRRLAIIDLNTGALCLLRLREGVKGLYPVQHVMATKSHREPVA